MAAKSTAKRSSPAPPRMPIEDYDRLPVKEILPRLTTLSGPELEAVAAYEKAGKNRVTLLKAVRKVELGREAAPTAPPASHLMVVDEGPELVAVPEPALDDRSDLPAMSEWSLDDGADLLAMPEWSLDDGADYLAMPEWSLDDGSELSAPEPVIDEPAPEAMLVAKAPARAARSAKPAKSRKSEKSEKSEKSGTSEIPEKSRPRRASRQVTWEEEVRPELPRRIESMAYDLDPPIVALVPSVDESEPTPSPASATTAGRRPSGPAKVRKFEGPALVMAAVLAVLLGLAIGTVLARTGSTTAQPAPPAAVSQVAATPPGG